MALGRLVAVPAAGVYARFVHSERQHASQKGRLSLVLVAVDLGGALILARVVLAHVDNANMAVPLAVVAQVLGDMVLDTARVVLGFQELRVSASHVSATGSSYARLMVPTS